MPRNLALGIDLGTSSVRAMLVDEQASIVATAARTYEVIAPSPGWAEQAPDVWWRETCTAVRSALDQVGDARVTAVSFSGQMHGTVLADGRGRPVLDAIIWADQRSSSNVESFIASHGSDWLAQRTANPLASGFQLATLLWLTEHRPEDLQRARHLLLPKDWLRYRMTGTAASDASDACSTLMFDTARGEWSGDVIRACGLDAEMLPEIRGSCDIAGELLRAPAQDMGLTPGTPVVTGAGDTPATAVGNGVLEPGSVMATIGSGGQVVAPASSPAYDTHLRTHTFCHAVPDQWYVMGAILSAGLSLKWLRNSVFGDPDLSYSSLSDQAGIVAPGAEGLVFLPYLTGERTPHLDPVACGVFFGLTPRHTRAHMVRAVMEGVAFALADGLDIVRELGTQPGLIVAAGGGSRSSVWRQIQADVFACPVTRAPVEEAAAYGAALMAGVGAGWWPGLSEAPRADENVGAAEVPCDANVARYREGREIYRELYPKLRDLMDRRARMAASGESS